MKFRCEDAEISTLTGKWGSPAWLGKGPGSGGGDSEMEREVPRKTEKRGRGPRRAEKEERDETKPKKAFYFFFFKEQKNKHAVSTDGKCSSAEGIIRTRDKETTEIGNNYFVSVFTNENEGH